MDGVLINDTLLIFAIIIGVTAFGMYAERRWRWAGILSGMGVSIFTAVALVTCHVLPTASGAYDVVFDYIMPLAIPMVLLEANIKRIIRESGHAFILMNVACLGAVVGGIAVGFLFRNNSYFAKDIAGYVAMEVGVCTGGTVNQAAMAKTFHVSQNVVGAAAVGSNLVAVTFLVVIGMVPNLKFFKKNFRHPYMDELEIQGADSGRTAETEAAKEGAGYTVLGLAKLLAFSFGVLGVSTLVCSFMDSLGLPTVFDMLFSNTYLVTSVLTLVVVTAFPKFAESMRFGQEIGSFMLLLFMTVMGTGASIIEIIQIAPMIVVAEIIIIFFIMTITLGITKIFKMNLEEALISINSSYGGPATACAYVGSKGWQRLMIPAVLIGVYGYIIGNALGILAGNIFL